MDRDTTIESSIARDFDTIWRDDHGYLVALASRMLGDPAEAEDAVQDAFGRLALVRLDEIDDVRGWLAVVVRRLCLDRIRSAHSRRESAAGAALPESAEPLATMPSTDPADRVTLDDRIQLALGIVLDRLSPAERTAFVLHDVFGLPFAAVGEVVGRTPAACRQLASRARRSIRASAPGTGPDGETTERRAVTERFIAACAGGDMSALMELLDPNVAGDATLYGHGPLVVVEGRPAVAQRLLGMFGPDTDTVLVPCEVERQPGVVVIAHHRLAAVVRLDATGGLIRHLHSVVFPPR